MYPQKVRRTSSRYKDNAIWRRVAERGTYKRDAGIFKCRDIRPMTDKVTVAAPTTVDFDIELTYYIPKDKEASTKEIKRAVDLAVESYELWQTSKMGRDINPSYFYAILMDSGIKRADIKKPVFTEIPKGSVAVLKKCTVTFGGVEDE